MGTLNSDENTRDRTPSVPAIKYGRTVKGMSAILLPFEIGGAVDWSSLESHIERTFAAGLAPAVNMDTGFANLIDDSTRAKVLSKCNEIAAGREFVAGCFVGDSEDADFDLDGYATAVAQVQKFNGTPIIFQSYGLTAGGDQEIIDNYQQIAKKCDRFYAFELGKMFAPFGEIYSMQVYENLMSISQCVGAKHSSLKRQAEWDRLILRDSVRPEFEVLTGNDLAIDMVMYGSDYLLGLSTMAPDLFAKRDQFWKDSDQRFYELNDKLQYLGFFAFRNPTSAYKHTAAQFLKLRGWVSSSQTHPGSLARPDSDVQILQEIASQLEIMEDKNG